MGGGYRYGGFVHFGGEFCVGTGYGGQGGFYLYANRAWIFCWLSDYCQCATSAVLPHESDQHLHLSRKSIREIYLQNRSFILFTVAYYWFGHPLVSGHAYSSAFNFRPVAYSVCGDGHCGGISDLVVHTPKWH